MWQKLLDTLWPTHRAQMISIGTVAFSGTLTCIINAFTERSLLVATLTAAVAGAGTTAVVVELIDYRYLKWQAEQRSKRQESLH